MAKIAPFVVLFLVIVLGAIPGSSEDVFYGYDELNRLTHFVSNGTEVLFSYDAAGNRTQVVVPEPSGAVPLALSFLMLLWFDRKRRLRIGRRPLNGKLGLSFRGFLSLSLLPVSVFAADLAVADELPGVRMVHRPPAVLYAVGQGPLTSAAAAAPAPGFTSFATQNSTSTEVTPEIQELARALKFDVDLIYEYVYSQIEYTPLWGSNKGAMGALLDGIGNDFDQASLMIALLRESGFAASFVYGQLRLNGATLINWLGVSDDAQMLGSFLVNTGRNPARIAIFANPPPGSTIAFADMERIWVKVNIGGTDFVFDPALKTQTVTPGIDLAAAMGYSQASFLAGARSGATITSDSIQNINQANLENALTGYSNNLASEIRTNLPGATLDDIVGGRTIDPLTNFPRVTSLPTQQTIFEEWAIDIPAAFRTTLRVQLPGIDETFNSDSLAGKRLTIFYESNQPVLRLDGVSVATGTTVTGGSTQQLQLSAAHGYSDTFFDSGGPVDVTAGGSFLVLNGWSETRSGTVRHHERRERANTHAGGTLLSEPILGEALAVFATSWLAQTNRACALASKLNGTHCFQQHRLGVTGQNASPFIDSPIGFLTPISNANDPDQELATFFNNGGHGSVFESGVIEQIQPGRAVSTVELIGLASDQSSKIFDATTANFASILPQLVNYSPVDLASVQSFLDAGSRVILPQNGGLIVDSWIGTGFRAFNPTTGNLGYIISEGLSGGSGTTNSTLDVQAPFTPPPTIRNASNDPIDLVSGDFLFDQTDLTVGSQPFPLGLGFKKSYNSGSRFNDSSLGLGWTHNFDLKATLGSDGFQGLGEDSPIDAVAAIVEQVVSLDLLTGSEPLDQVVITMLTQRWFMQQLTDNVVTVSEPETTSVFVRLPDGTFNPPPGSASELTVLPAGNFQIETKNGVRLAFRNDGNIGFSVDPNGNQVVWSYNSGDLQSVSDAAGHTLTFSYVGDRISSVSDGTRSFGYAYDGDGNLTVVTDANGQTTAFQYLGDGLLNRIFTPANPLNPRVFNTYNSLGHVESQVDANGNLWTYHIAGSRSEEVDPSLNSKITYYTDRDKIARDIDALGFETTFDYDGEERVIFKSAPEGNFVLFEYDASHNLTKETLFPKPASALPPIVREFTYEPVFNRVATSTNPRLNVTSFSYDGNGNPLSIIQPVVGGQAPITGFTYNSRGQVSTTTDPEGTVTAFSYDPVTANLLTRTEDVGAGGLALVTSMTYNAAGDRLSQTDPLGNTISFEIDNMRRVTQTTSPAPFSNITLITNDEDGNVTQVSRETGDVTAPWQTTTTTYSFSGKVSAATDPALQVTLSEYDVLDRVSRVTDAMGQVTQLFYDARGSLERVVDAKGVTSKELTYTANGQEASAKDANGNTTGFQYDGFDRLDITNFPNSDFERLTYDDASNLTLKRTRSGSFIGFAYDSLDRLVTKAPTGVATINLDYDLAGRLLEVADGAGLTSFAYDALGRRVSVVHPGGETLGYAYDDNGNRSRLNYPDGHFVTYQYDQMNRLQRVSDLGAISTAFFTYDALSRVVAMNRANFATTTFTYEIDDDLESISHQFGLGAPADFSYVYNAVHNRTKTTLSNSQFAFNFLAPPTTTYVSNNMNQYTDVDDGVVSFGLGYDGNGNLDFPANSDSYIHDIENRLIGATTSTATASYTYDAFGTRTSKTVNGIVTNYILDGNQVIAEYDGLGQQLRRYVYAGIDRPIQMTTQTATYYYHADALGSVVALSNATGNLVETYALGPYGQIAQPSFLGNPYLYTGREYDPETGLYYYRNRYYDPVLGRFLEPDPIGTTGGLNLYAYVGGNPVNFVDPLGLFAQGGSQSGGSFFEGLGQRFSNLATFGQFETDSQFGSRLASMEAAFLANGTQGLADFVRQNGAVGGTRAILEAGAGGIGFSVLKAGGSTLAEAAGGRLLGNGDILVSGGRARAKSLFRFFDDAGVGNRAIVRDTTGGGRAVVGNLSDGTSLRIRFLPDGRTRLQSGSQKFRFGE